jgi:hypothetical protein
MQIRGTHHSEKSLAYKSETTNRPSRAEVEQAVSTLIRWAGDDPDREGLIETPARVARAYEQWFAGYGEDPEEFLQRTFRGRGHDRPRLRREDAKRLCLSGSSRCRSSRLTIVPLEIIDFGPVMAIGFW